MRNSCKLLLLSILLLDASCSAPHKEVLQEIKEAEVDIVSPSDKLITIIPDSQFSYMKTTGLVASFTTSIETALGHFEIEFSDKTIPLISKTYYDINEEAVIVNPVETDYFKLIRIDDFSYTIELFPTNNPHTIVIRLCFLPLTDFSYTMGLVYITGQ